MRSLPAPWESALLFSPQRLQGGTGSFPRWIFDPTPLGNQDTKLPMDRTCERTKTKAMRHKYKRVCAHNSRSGNSRATCPYFAELHRILGGYASLRPRRVARSLKLRWILGEGPSSQQSTQGQEHLEQQGELATINMADIATTSGAEGGSNFVEPCVNVDFDSQCEDSQSALDVLPEDADMETAAVASEVDQAEEGGADDGNIGETDPAEQSVEERLAGARQHRKKISVLNDVATQMLQQAEREAEAAQIRHRELLQKEDTLDEALRAMFREEARLDREAFREAMDRGVAAIESSTNAILQLGERLLSPRQARQSRVAPSTPVQDVETSTSHAVPGTSTSSEGIPAGGPPAKKKRVVKKVKRMDM